MAKPVIHISDTEAARDFTGLLAHVRAGSEVIIEHDAQPVAVLRPAGQRPWQRPWLLSEAIVLAEAHACSATLDEGFAKDLEAVVNSHREPLNPPEWD